MPKISVIMGVYNGSKGVKRAVNSILNQTFTDFELLICDDGSTDNSFEILKEIANKDDRIKLFQNNKNKGLAVTLNRCLFSASGDYIARMDDDDFSYPNRFEKQVEFLETNEEYSVLGTSRIMFDNKGKWGKSILVGERSKLDIFLGNNFVHPSVMMNKSAVLSVGGYSEGSEIGRTEDYDLWCKLYKAGYKGYNLQDILIEYYEDKGSYNKRKYKYRIAEYRLKKKWRKTLKIPYKYHFFIFRPLIVGLIPQCMLIKYHTKKFNSEFDRSSI